MIENKYVKGRVSIGIPTFNRPENLENLLILIGKQTYNDLEIIISNNASTDLRVTNVIDKYSKIDKRIQYYTQERNIGILQNFQFVLEKASGEYFTWISDDDWRSPEFIEELVNLLEENKAINFAFCDYHEVYENGSFANGYPFSHLSYFKPFTSNKRLVRTLSHFWQNQKNGKCNLFYSVFRREKLLEIDFQQISFYYAYFGLDNQIAFKMLQSGPVILSKDAMCCLTCQNTKHYLKKENISNAGNIVNRFLDFIKSQFEDFYIYLGNTSSLIEKFCISFLFLPKSIFEISDILFTRLVKFFHKTLLISKSKEKIAKRVIVNCKNEKILQLPNVTLVSIDTRDTEDALKALKYSSQYIDFGQVKLLSHYTPFCDDTKIKIERIPKIKNIDDWCHFVVYELHEYIETDFILLIHSDGFVVNPSEWRAEFLDYDYIGSPWPLPTDEIAYRDINGNIIRVGNSVSIRSKKLLELPSKLNIPWIADHGFFNEDGFLCCTNRHILLENGIKYAPLNVAKYFAHESMIPEIKNIRPFAFHKWMGTNSKYPRFKKRRLL